MKFQDKLSIPLIDHDFAISSLTDNSWSAANEIEVTHYWSGENSPAHRYFRASLLWSDTALYTRFVANQDEPMVVNDNPNLKEKTNRLWERDVCEIFVAPDFGKFHRYYEFEVAPTGEWVDLGVHQKPNGRDIDWSYRSNMEVAADVGDSITMAIKIPWHAFEKRPEPGDIWLGNLFRAVGEGENRGYLSWQPTMTETPNFHVPEKFGKLEFVR